MLEKVYHQTQTNPLSDCLKIHKQFDVPFLKD